MDSNLSPPTSTQLHHAQALAHVEEYIQIVCALVLNIFAIPSNETMTTLHFFQPLAQVNLSLLSIISIRRWRLFQIRMPLIFLLGCSPCFSFDDFSNMVYELLQDCFVRDDFMCDFEFFFKYVNTLLMVMFLHLYHVYFWHHEY